MLGNTRNIANGSKESEDEEINTYINRITVEIMEEKIRVNLEPLLE